MATHDRSGNAYGSPAKAATNSQRGSRDVAGGGVVGRYSAATRNAERITPEQEKSSIAAGKTPQSQMGSQTDYQVTNNANSAEGATMNKVKSDYRASRKSGMSPDDARGQALSSNQSQTKMTRDAYGKAV